MSTTPCQCAPGTQLCFFSFKNSWLWSLFWKLTVYFNSLNSLSTSNFSSRKFHCMCIWHHLYISIIYSSSLRRTPTRFYKKSWLSKWAQIFMLNQEFSTKTHELLWQQIFHLSFNIETIKNFVHHSKIMRNVIKIMPISYRLIFYFRTRQNRMTF